MNTVVMHSSKYGATTRYAEWIAEELGGESGPVPTYSSADALRDPGLWEDADVLVLGVGLKGDTMRAADLIAALPPERVVLFTVGIQDPATTDYSVIDAQLPEGLQGSGRVFHLRAHVDPSAGSGAAVINTHAAVETTMDRDAIAPIVAAAQALEAADANGAAGTNGA